MSRLAGARESRRSAMAMRSEKSLRGSIDDMLEDILGHDDEAPDKSASPSQPAGVSSGRARGSSSQASKKSFLDDDFFSKLPAEDKKAAEGSGVSDAEPKAVLQTLKDIDDFEADLVRLSKPSSGVGKAAVKGPGKCSSSEGAVKTSEKLPAPEKGESAPAKEKKPPSSPPAFRQYKKFNFDDISDPLDGLLSEEQDAPKKPASRGSERYPEEKAEPGKEKKPLQTPLPTAAPVRGRKEVRFEDDDDDMMDALGFGSGRKGDQKQGKKAEEEEVRPARSKMDELLGRGSVAKILEPPGPGQRREFQLDKKYQKQPEKEEGRDKDDVVFGAYQPTVATAHEGRTSRRQSVRFSAENSSEPKPDPPSRGPPAASQSPARGSRAAGGDWLGCKDEDVMDLELLSPAPAKASPAMSSRQLQGTQAAAAKPDQLEEEDWLSAALSRKKAQAEAKARERSAAPLETPDKGLDPCPPVRQGHPVPWLGTATQASARPSEPAKKDPPRDGGTIGPAASPPAEQEKQGSATLTQVTTPRAPLPAAPQLQSESPALGSLHERSLGAPTAQPCEDVTGYRAALLSAQARVAELESQVRILELERTQHKLLLESLQQRHQGQLDLLENAHRSHLKVMEETYGQREEWLRREKDLLVAQLLSQSQEAERARAELVAQHQQRVAMLEQQNAQDVERLRELQRSSVQEMRKDHEEQLQRLKRLKDQEIDAVTSATLHTRSLNGVIEQMERFSSDLHSLSNKVEATHNTASQVLAMGARQCDEQLRELQDRLLQQQRDMEEERGRLQEMIAKMDARLSKQTQLLEQEQWRATALQTKVESLQHSLEEQRQAMTQQLSLEQAELERTKEQAELKIRGCELKAKEEQLARDRELLDKAWHDLRLEKEKVKGAALRIQQREEEIKEMDKLSSQKYEEGEKALRESCRVESEHQNRLRVIQQHLEQLKQQEQQLQQERLSMAYQRRQLEQLREELSRNPTLPLTTGQDLSASTKGHSSTLSFPPPVTTILGHKSLVTPAAVSLYTQLLLLKNSMRQDRDFLEDEQLFLEALSKASYSASPP